VTRAVLDASAVVELLRGTAAGRRLVQALGRDPDLHVPALCGYEVANVLRTLSRQGGIPEARARAALTDLRDLPAVRHPVEPLLPRIWALRDNLTVYDAAYVALAEALDGTLYTADRRLAGAPNLRIRIADWPS
jgi:predicted nucleic acid-binding protein